ncbi:MAG: Rrf2 family transcriptional regulator [Deltaproteobacteria bacterium]|nr:Rrf2 family transcriptional regulator [Deltaproteobacteria bacterium]
MKITALEEYGLRCLLQVARAQKQGISIRQIAQLEGLSIQYVSKITSHLKKSGFIQSTRGVHGGYKLVRDPENITLQDISRALSDDFFPDSFCGHHPGQRDACVHECNCSIRSVWRSIYHVISGMMEQVTLEHLLKNEIELQGHMKNILGGIPKRENIDPRARSG